MLSSLLSLRSSLVTFSVTFSVLAAVACGGATVDPPGSGDPTAPGAASTGTSATPGTQAATGSGTGNPPPPPGACNALLNVGPLVTGRNVAAYAPAATGGVVTDGTYHLVDLAIYKTTAGKSGPTGLLLKQTISIHGGICDAITESGGMSRAVTTTFVTSRTHVTTAETCPTASMAETGEYSATPTSIVMFPSGSQTLGYTYEL